MWEVEYTDQFEQWWNTLVPEEQEFIDAAVRLLEARGPALGRPLADHIKSSRHQHMKELRPGGSLRILFAFDPRRVAILLLGGDKAEDWDGWYREFVPSADDLYDEHLREISGEDTLRELKEQTNA